MTRTRQEIFDLAWNGLKAQGFERSILGRKCVYRAGDGLKCAIGHCIRDEAYHIGLEGFRREPFALAGVDIDDPKFFGFAASLQSAHDGGETPSEMEQRLRAFADFYSLTIPS